MSFGLHVESIIFPGHVMLMYVVAKVVAKVVTKMVVTMSKVVIIEAIMLVVWWCNDN